MTRRRPPVNDNVVPNSLPLNRENANEMIRQRMVKEQSARLPVDQAVEAIIALAPAEPYTPTDLEVLLNTVFHTDDPCAFELLDHHVGRTQNRETHDGSLSDNLDLWTHCRDLRDSIKRAQDKCDAIRAWAERHGYDQLTGKRFTR